MINESNFSKRPSIDSNLLIDHSTGLFTNDIEDLDGPCTGGLASAGDSKGMDPFTAVLLSLCLHRLGIEHLPFPMQRKRVKEVVEKRKMVSRHILTMLIRSFVTKRIERMTEEKSKTDSDGISTLPHNSTKINFVNSVQLVPNTKEAFSKQTTEQESVSCNDSTLTCQIQAQSTEIQENNSNAKNDATQIAQTSPRVQLSQSDAAKLIQAAYRGHLVRRDILWDRVADAIWHATVSASRASNSTRAVEYAMDSIDRSLNPSEQEKAVQMFHQGWSIHQRHLTRLANDTTGEIESTRQNTNIKALDHSPMEKREQIAFCDDVSNETKSDRESPSVGALEPLVNEQTAARPLHTYPQVIVPTQGDSLGLRLESDYYGFAAVIKQIDKNGSFAQAVMNAGLKLRPGMVLIAVNDQSMVANTFETVMTKLRQAWDHKIGIFQENSILLTFCDPELYYAKLQGGGWIDWNAQPIPEKAAISTTWARFFRNMITNSDPKTDNDNDIDKKRQAMNHLVLSELHSLVMQVKNMENRELHNE